MDDGCIKLRCHTWTTLSCPQATCRQSGVERTRAEASRSLPSERKPVLVIVAFGASRPAAENVEEHFLNFRKSRQWRKWCYNWTDCTEPAGLFEQTRSTRSTSAVQSTSSHGVSGLLPNICIWWHKKNQHDCSFKVVPAWSNANLYPEGLPPRTPSLHHRCITRRQSPTNQSALRYCSNTVKESNSGPWRHEQL